MIASNPPIALHLAVSLQNPTAIQKATANAVSSEEFKLNDTLPVPIIVTCLLPTCGCSSAIGTVPGGGHQTFPLKLFPGHSVEIRMTVNLQDLPPGPYDKFVYVMCKGQTRPAAVLEMKGIVPSPVTFSPASVDFGSMASGVGKSLTVESEFDPALLASAQPPALISTNPSIMVQKLSGLLMKGGASVSETYRVVVSPNAPAGPLAAAWTWTAIKAGSIRYSVPLPIHGEVIGEIRADPSELLLTTIADSFGKANDTQSVTINATDANNLAGLTVSSDSPVVSALLQTSESGVMISVTALPSSASGLSTSLITVTEANGKQLIIPVRVIR